MLKSKNKKYNNLLQTSNRDCIRWIIQTVYNKTCVVRSICWDTLTDRQLYQAFIEMSNVSSRTILHSGISWYE